MNIIKRNKKINFEEVDLVLCKIALVTERTVLPNADIRYEFRIFPEIRILARKFSKFYFEPINYSKDWKEPDYGKLYSGLDVGDRFVESTDNIPIQRIPGIPFTEKELKTKKITLKRIKELEDLLNSK